MLCNRQQHWIQVGNIGNGNYMNVYAANVTMDNSTVESLHRELNLVRVWMRIQESSLHSLLHKHSIYSAYVHNTDTCMQMFFRECDRPD